MGGVGVGNPERLSTDVGPVISAEARQRLVDHIERMRTKGHAVTQAALPSETQRGLFVPPTIIEIGSIAQLSGGGFGPGLHGLRYRRERPDAMARPAHCTGVRAPFALASPHRRSDL